MVIVIPSGALMVPGVLEMGRAGSEARTRRNMNYTECCQGFVLGSYQGYLISPGLVQLYNSTSTRDHRIGKRQFGLELGTTRLFCGMRWVEISDPFPGRVRQGL